MAIDTGLLDRVHKEFDEVRGRVAMFSLGGGCINFDGPNLGFKYLGSALFGAVIDRRGVDWRPRFCREISCV